MKPLARIFAVLITSAAALGPLAMPAAAHGDWRVGIGIGVAPVWPFYYPPPVYYPPPPVYYAPPPGYYSPYPGYIAQMPPQAPPAPAAPAPGIAQSCNAGQYICPMQVSVPVGGRCYCRDNNGGRVYGTAQ